MSLMDILGGVGHALDTPGALTRGLIGRAGAGLRGKQPRHG